MKHVWHLHKLNWLRELSSEEVEQLRRASATIEYASEEMVFAPEPNPESVYLLHTGLVRIFRISSSGSETTFGYVAPGEVFGELAAFGDYPRESFAQAVTAAKVWRIPRDVFHKLLEARPGLAIEITRQIGDRFKRIESRVENLVFRDVRARVALILLELAEDFGRDTDDGLLLEVALTQSDLATLIGSTRQSVNASLRELEHEGLVGRRGRRVLLPRPEALRSAAEGLAPAVS